jgi:hypothetical protein
MISRERVMEIYAEAYEAETGMPLTLDQIDNNEFEDFRFEYDSRSGRSIITIFEFTDNDTFPGPDTVTVVKYDNDTRWRLV